MDSKKNPGRRCDFFSHKLISGSHFVLFSLFDAGMDQGYLAFLLFCFLDDHSYCRFPVVCLDWKIQEDGGSPFKTEVVESCARRNGVGDESRRSPT